MKRSLVIYGAGCAALLVAAGFGAQRVRSGGPADGGEVASVAAAAAAAVDGKHLQHLRISSEALKGNLLGDPHERGLVVLLPPSYFSEPGRQFPAVYLLHGLGSRKDGHLGAIPVLEAAFKEMKADRLSEMILVGVDGTTSLGGSYYAKSPTIGNFEEYVTRELVAFVEQRFRALPSSTGRAVAGFSMGGHGALKLVMKHPGIFSAAASLSGSPMSIRYRKNIYKDALKNRRRARSLEELTALYPYETSWSTAAAYAKGAAFSPNPRRPPLFLDLPFESKGSDLEDPVWQLWWDDDPLSLVAGHQKALRALNLLYLDHGDNETALGTEDFDRELTRYGIGHTHYIFRGDHSDFYVERHIRMLRHLSAGWNITD